MTKLKGKDMEKWMKCYVGTNSLRGSKGIYTLEINTQNGEMREVSTVEADDSAYLYVSERENVCMRLWNHWNIKVYRVEVLLLIA